MYRPNVYLFVLLSSVLLQPPAGSTDPSLEPTATGETALVPDSLLTYHPGGRDLSDPAPLARPDSSAGRDTLLTVRPGDSLAGIAARLLSQTQHYTNPALVDEIRRSNELFSDTIQPGQELRISLDYDAGPARTGPRSRDFVARGIYVNDRIAATNRILDLAQQLVAAGGNTIVFDIKEKPGDLSYVSHLPLAAAIGASRSATVRQPLKLVGLLHQMGIHVVARIVCFYDARLARARPDLTPASRATGGPWCERGEPGWVDPSQPEVQRYLLAIIGEVATMGVDEIQLDYIRFPTEGKVADAVFAYDPDLVANHQIITGFLGRARQVLEDTDVLLAADIFGVVAWGRAADIARTGQNLADMLPLLDVVSPMLYPSHFYGRFDQISNPVEHPYYFVNRGCRNLSRAARGHQVVIRPWIQAFPYRVPVFDEDYVIEQLRAAEEGGARGWMLWSSAGRYAVGLAAVDRFLRQAAAADSVGVAELSAAPRAASAAARSPSGARLGSGVLHRRFENTVLLR